jgi:hypothetical protein
VVWPPRRWLYVGMTTQAELWQFVERRLTEAFEDHDFEEADALLDILRSHFEDDEPKPLIS